MTRCACPLNPSGFRCTLMVCVVAIATVLPFRLSAKEPETLTSALSVLDMPDDVSVLLADVNVCEPLADLVPRDIVIVVDDPAAFSRLFIVPCGGGGYNLTYVVLIESAGDLVVQNFDTYSEPEGWSTSHEVFNVEWDDTQRELSTFRKGSSLGNCGAIGKWRYEFGTLSLSTYSYQARCDGRMLPSQFPVVREGP